MEGVPMVTVAPIILGTAPARTKAETGPQAVTPLQVAQPVVMMRRALNKPLFIVHFSLLYILPVSLSTDEDCPVFLLADIASQFYPAAA